MRKLISILLVLFSSYLYGQQSEKYLIKSGKLFDSETGQFKTGMSVLISGSKIISVKPDKDLTAAEKKEYLLIDLSKYAVLPGLIDCHTHLLYKEVQYAGNDMAGLDMGKMLTLEGDAYRAIYGTARAKAYLEAGRTLATQGSSRI